MAPDDVISKLAQISPNTVTSLLPHLALVKDPRKPKGILHLFSDILAILKIGFTLV